MKDPIDVLGVHPTGALVRPEDARDYPFHSPEIGMATAPFNWHEGYDVEADVASILGTGFQLPTKDQSQSYSCGGQAISTYAHVLSSAYLKDTTEKSAKAVYSQVFAPGGGSNDRELAKIYTKQGLYKESLVPSYPAHGVGPSESFMERVGDISSHARTDAAHQAGLIAYSFPYLDIDSIAQSIKASKGTMIGLYGTNNGTWLSDLPKPPTSGYQKWAHYMYFGKAFLQGGKKYLWGKQSWGESVGDNGWQKIGEDYFNAKGIWSAMNLIFNVKPVSVPHHVFNTDLALGMTNADVSAMQEVLAYDGVFNLAPTGHYGNITAQAVFHFQVKHSVAPLDQLNRLGGRKVGPATRAALNAVASSI